MKSYFRIIVKTLVLLAMAVCMWQVLTPYFRLDKNEEGELFQNIPENSLDVIALGSSHMQYAFNPSVFYEHTGYYSYVLGSECQPMSMSYSLLEEALKTQHPSIVVLDVFTLLSQSQVCYADGMYYIAMQETTGMTKIEAGRQVPDKELGLQYTFDFMMNHSNWRYLDFSDPQSILEKARKAEGVNDTLGYVMQMPTDFRYIPLMTYEPHPYRISDSAVAAIDRIISLCSKNDIELIFVKTPYTIDQEDTDQLNAIWNYLDEKNQEHIDFIAMADELHWFTGMDGDTWHNNAWGANIITKYLADYILEHHPVKNHTDCSILNQVLNEGSYNTARQLMGSENINVYDVLDAAAYFNCTILVKYTSGYFPIGEYENHLLQSAGLNHDFISDSGQCYYAVIENGKVIQESEKPFDTVYEGHQISLSDEGILINGNAYDDNSGVMELVFCSKKMSWYNAIGLKPSEYGFWKKGCLSWDCGN